MLALLIWVLILGVVAWVVKALPIPQPFKTVAYAIIIIVLILALAHALGIIAIPPLR